VIISILHDNALAHRALATRKKLAYLGFQFLDHPPYSPDLAPSDYQLFPGLKNNLNVAIFRPTRRSFLPRRPGWTEKLLNVLSGLKTLEQRDKKFIELRVEYVE
jgi:transposase